MRLADLPWGLVWGQPAEFLMPFGRINILGRGSSHQYFPEISVTRGVPPGGYQPQ